MKKLAIGLVLAASIGFFAWAAWAILSAPPEPPFGWPLSMSLAQHDARVAVLDHHYRVAAYAITWAIQLGYVSWLGLKWLGQMRAGRSQS